MDDVNVSNSDVIGNGLASLLLNPGVNRQKINHVTGIIRKRERERERERGGGRERKCLYAKVTSHTF